MIDRKKKLTGKTFKQYELSITTECNLKTVDFLDIAFILQNKGYKPYRKANDKPIYRIKNSNHPPIILKQLPKAIEKDCQKDCHHARTYLTNP